MRFTDSSYFEINEQLLNLLDDCEDINIFSEISSAFLQSEIKVNNISIAQYQDIENIEVGEGISYYHYLVNRDNKPDYLINFAEIFQKNHALFLEGNLFNGYSKKKDNNQNYYNYFTQLDVQQVDIFPILFKRKLLGYLIIEHNGLTKNLTRENYNYLCRLVAKNFGIFIYQNKLIEKSEKIEQQEKNLLAEKEKQRKYLSHMNHEIRTPLAAVVGFAKMLKTQIYGELNNKQKEYVEAIYQSGNYLLSLISDILDMAKIEANKEELYITETEIKELCECCLSLVKIQAKEQGLKLNLYINSSVNSCMLDKTKVQQILVNLLSNAVKYTEVGSVTLQVDNDDKYISFCVRDTGIGIKESNYDKLFKPFSQIHTHLHQKHKGTGLGLAIARELSKLHDGYIEFTSVENKGSCFTFYLPLNFR